MDGTRAAVSGVAAPTVRHRLVGGPVMLLAVLPAAVGIGVWSDQGQRISGFGGHLPELGTPWVVLAFVAARLIPRRTRWASPVAAICVIVVGLCSYAVYMHVRYGLSYHNVSGGRMHHWFALGLVAGALAGILGWLSYSHLAVVAWAVLAAVPLAEIRLAEGWSIDDQSFFAVAGLLVAASMLLIVWGVLTMRRAPLVLALVTAVAWAVGWALAVALLGGGIL
jgi:hypothetical protein